MRNWNWKQGLILATLLLLHVGGVQAEEPLLIVTDPWPPYALTADDGTVIGTDVEIIEAVFQQLDIAVNVQFYPWKRCLYMVEQHQADAILDAALTPERQEFLHFPAEPVSEGVTVFFVKKDRHIPFTHLDDLNGLRAGTLLGYSYCDEIDSLPFIKQSERVGTLEQNFKKLLADRLDFVVEVDAVGYFTAKQMGILDQIDIIPNALYCKGGNYLAFSQKPGYKQLTSQFNEVLKAFKKSSEYTRILSTYGQK